MPQEIPFTKTAIGRLKPPAKGRATYYDSRTPSFALTVTPTGHKSFYVYRRVNGRPARVRLGGYPELTPEMARKAAAEINAQIARGIDPNAGKRRDRESMTVKGLFEYYLEQHAKPHKRTWQEDQAQYDRYLKRGWGRRKLDAIRRTDVQALHTKLGRQAGVYAANRLRSRKFSSPRRSPSKAASAPIPKATSSA